MRNWWFKVASSAGHLFLFALDGVPVSTPSNALAYTTWLLANRQLLQISALISGICLVGFLSVVNVALANWILLTFLLVVLVSLL